MKIRKPSEFEAGIFLGLLWTLEIAVNNLFHPPLPGRDIFDDVIWIIVGIAIFIAAAISSYKDKKINSGVKKGFWLGLGSGLVACITALLLVIFGMKYIISDPLAVAEWTNQKPSIQMPNIQTYFMYQTLAGAVLHLVVLGIGMGVVLGVFGGIVGKSVRLGLPSIGYKTPKSVNIGKFPEKKSRFTD